LNITNPDEVIAGKEKPNLVEMGPYSYRQYKQKFNVSFPFSGNEICYKTWEYFVFDPSTSCPSCTTSDTFTTLNIPLLIVQGNLGYNWWQSLALDLLASRLNSSLFVTVNVNEFCVSGYLDPLLQFLGSVGIPNIPPTFQIQPNMTSQAMADNMTKHDIQITGKDNFSMINEFVEYQEQTALTVWGSPWANRITGTDGYQFSPSLRQSQTVTAFVDTTMRVLTAKSNETVTIKGIKMDRFRLDPVNIMNATLYPPNAGYYQFGPSGVMNRTSTAMLAKLFLSKPHYLDADPFYLNQVTGLSPNRTAHDTWIDVEPITGSAMNANERLMIVLRVQPIPLLYQNINDTYIPTLWIEVASSIPSDLAKIFRTQVYTVTTIITVSKWVGWIGGPLLMLSSIIIFVVVHFHSKKKEDYVLIQ